jgi:hypothetical protein
VTESASVRFRLSAAERVRIAVYDLLGREVALLVDDVVPPGDHTLTWRPGRLPNGTYVVRGEAGVRREGRLFSVIR